MATISDLQKGLVGHWTMNSEDTDNGQVRDRSAYDNHATLNGNYGVGLPAPSGTSVSLNGKSGTYIDVPSSSNYNSKTFSISVWVNVESIHTGDSRIVYHDGSNSAITTGFGIEYRGCGGSFGGGPSSNVDEWNHLTYIWDDGNDEYRTYLDGQLTNQSGMGGGCFANSNGGFNLGTPHWTTDGSYLRGKISDVRAYDRVLSETEIQQLANQRTSAVTSVGGIDISDVSASGGNEYTKTVTDVDYKIHEFTSDGTFTVNEGGTVDALIVAGGGGGGGRHGAGGGAGGVIYRNSYQISSGSYSVTIGSGGSGGPGNGGPGTKGENSIFDGLTALGGGGGNSYDGNATNPDGGSGSGGAASAGSSGLQPTSTDGGFGNDGGTGQGSVWNHGGGGGAGEVGEDGEDFSGGSPGAGGGGLYFGDAFSDSFGEDGYFAGGGGGGSHNDKPDTFKNEGGKGGGGHGGEEPYDTNTDSGSTGDDGEPGMANTGGGGGGGSTNSGNGGGGGNGGSGIVLIRYKK